MLELANQTVMRARRVFDYRQLRSQF